MTTESRKAVKVTVFSVLLMAAIFAVDVSTPPGRTGWLLNLYPIILSSSV